MHRRDSYAMLSIRYATAASVPSHHPIPLVALSLSLTHCLLSVCVCPHCVVYVCVRCIHTGMKKHARFFIVDAKKGSSYG